MDEIRNMNKGFMRKDGKYFLPVTHESLVIDNDGVSMSKKYTSKDYMYEYVTDYVAEEILKAQLNGAGVDMSKLATKEDLKTKADSNHTHDAHYIRIEEKENLATTDALNAKVDKRPGYSLVSNDEISRLSELKDYDDTPIKESLKTKADSNHVHSDYLTETNIANLGYANKQYVDEAIKNVETAAMPNFTYKINMVSINEEPSVVTTGDYPDLIITFNIPQGSNTEVPTYPSNAKMWIGWLPYDERALEGFSDISDITTNLDYRQIRYGLNKNILLEMQPCTGRIELPRLSVAGDYAYMCCIYPKDCNYTIFGDNGFGVKVDMKDWIDTNHEEGTTSTGYDFVRQDFEPTNTIEGIKYCISGAYTSDIGTQWLNVVQ